jgi:hypothetical protein
MQIIALRWMILVGVALLLLPACERTENDILSLMPENTRLLFENEYIRVLGITLEPGQAQPLHMSGDRLIFALSDYTIRYYQPEDMIEISWNAGGVHWHQRGVSAVENAGETVVDYILIERKAKSLPSPRTDIESILPYEEEITVIFENDHAQVARFIIPSGESVTAAANRDFLIYALSDFQITYVHDGEDATDHTADEGEVRWFAAGAYTAENTGTDDAVYIAVLFTR